MIFKSSHMLKISIIIFLIVELLRSTPLWTEDFILAGTDFVTILSFATISVLMNE
jgi:hypothetical protein